MERKIGEEFEYNGMRLKVAKLGTMRYWNLRNKTNQTHTRYDE